MKEIIVVAAWLLTLLALIGFILVGFLDVHYWAPMKDGDFLRGLIIYATHMLALCAGPLVMAFTKDDL